MSADLVARETAKLSSNILKRVITPLETVRTIAKADSMIFPVALILVLSSPTMTALSSLARYLGHESGVAQSDGACHE
jgi:hypothetical protein